MNNDIILDFYFVLTALYLLFIRYGIPTLLIFIAYKVKSTNKILSLFFLAIAILRLVV